MNNHIFIYLTNVQAKKLKDIWKHSINSSHSTWALALLLSNKKYTVQCIEKRLQEKEQTIRSTVISGYLAEKHYQKYVVI